MKFHFPYGGWFVPGKPDRFDPVGIYGHFEWALENVPEMDDLDIHQNIGDIYYKQWMIKNGYGFVKFGSGLPDDFHGIQARRSMIVRGLARVIAEIPEAEFCDWTIEPVDFRRRGHQAIKITPRQLRTILRTKRIP